MKAGIIECLRATGPTIAEIGRVSGAPGISVAVAHHGQTIHEAHFGYRNLQTKDVPDMDTHYAIASLSKAFTAAAIGILVDDGKLRYDTPLNQILTDFDHYDPIVNQQLTVRELLTHTTGLAAANHWWYGAGARLLLKKKDLIPAFNKLEHVWPVRSHYAYSNWGYAVAGAVIEMVSGMGYGEFLKARVFDPLEMHESSVDSASVSEQMARPYTVLDDGKFYQLPLPPSNDGTIMAPAQGVISTAADMLKFSTALLAAQKAELDGSCGSSHSVLKNVANQLTFHVPTTGPSLLERSYGYGFHRIQLPNPFAGLGCNGMFVRKMPTLSNDEDSTLAITHPGSLAGYTSAFTLLPEHNVSLIVFTNSIGFGDPADWINQLLVEMLVAGKTTNDYIAMAEEAKQSHVQKFKDMEVEFRKSRESATPLRPTEDYLGTYINQNQMPFKIVISRKDNEDLQVMFQGLESQTWDLHLSGEDVLDWFCPRDELAKRALFTYSGPDLFKLRFGSDDKGNINHLCWRMDPAVPQKRLCFNKTSDTSLRIQKI